MNNPDHISESVETIFWVKIQKFFDADPRSGMEKIWIRDKHPGSATLILTTHHPRSQKTKMSLQKRVTALMHWGGGGGGPV
jgi:hypothetical protein